MDDTTKNNIEALNDGSMRVSELMRKLEEDAENGLVELPDTCNPAEVIAKRVEDTAQAAINDKSRESFMASLARMFENIRITEARLAKKGRVKEADKGWRSDASALMRGVAYARSMGWLPKAQPTGQN